MKLTRPHMAILWNYKRYQTLTAKDNKKESLSNKLTIIDIEVLGPLHRTARCATWSWWNSVPGLVLHLWVHVQEEQEQDSSLTNPQQYKQ